MGNSQSFEPCKAFCWVPGPSAKVDDGEWFGDLPRKKKPKKKSRPSRNLTKMPVLQEQEERSFGGGSIGTSEENGTPFSRSTSSLEGPGAASAPVKSVSNPGPSTAKGMEMEKPDRRQPKVKLTFVNGQFVDPSSKQGQAIIEAASSPEDAGAIGGIVISVDAGHRGIMGRTLSAGEDRPSLKSGRRHTLTKSMKDMLQRHTSDESSPSKRRHSMRGKLHRQTSHESSTSSLSSCSTASQSSSNPNMADSTVSSIVALGDGQFFLTASKCDRVIKMWRGTEAAIEFVRDFVGHHTAVTCLATVGEKGRFLSASKDKVIKLWDSRFDCEDEDDRERTLLASFDNVDRSISKIAIIDDGSYVRPTDQVDMAMVTAMAKKVIKEGTVAVQKAAHEHQVSDMRGVSLIGGEI